MHNALLWEAAENLSLRSHDKFRNGVEASKEQNILEVKKQKPYLLWVYLSYSVNIRSQTNVKNILQIP